MLFVFVQHKILYYDFYMYVYSDINECEEEHNNNCTQICINQYGSFHCECRDGFMLQADGKHCLGT